MRDVSAEVPKWEAYFYPGTRTLRNIPGMTDAHKLRLYEYNQTAARQAQLDIGLVQIPQTFDLDHMKALHAHLFQDVYEWAGQVREVTLYKGSGEFADWSTGEIKAQLERVAQLAHRQDLATLTQAEFADVAGEVFTHVNYAHPFREGNGRTAKAFMDDLARRTGFSFDFARVGDAAWNAVSHNSRPARVGLPTNPAVMKQLFQTLTVPRGEVRKTLQEVVMQKRAMRAVARDAGRLPPPAPKPPHPPAPKL